MPAWQHQLTTLPLSQMSQPSQASPQLTPTASPIGQPCPKCPNQTSTAPRCFSMTSHIPVHQHHTTSPTQAIPHVILSAAKDLECTSTTLPCQRQPSPHNPPCMPRAL